MKIAVPVTGNEPSGPGEAEEVVIIETSTGEVVERYPNPALTATSARGITMLMSAIERNAEVLVVAGIGQHAIDFARTRIRILGGAGLTIDEIVKAAKNGQLKELTEANHMGHHHH